MSLLKSASLIVVFCLFIMITGCSPEVGSDGWCEDMKEKPKGNWTASETADYAKHCILK